MAPSRTLWLHCQHQRRWGSTRGHDKENADAKFSKWIFPRESLKSCEAMCPPSPRCPFILANQAPTKSAQTLPVGRVNLFYHIFKSIPARECLRLTPESTYNERAAFDITIIKPRIKCSHFKSRRGSPVAKTLNSSEQKIAYTFEIFICSHNWTLHIKVPCSNLLSVK